jgi:dynein light intermediate chain 1, cytosolic
VGRARGQPANGITDGASLIYTTPSLPSPLPSLVHASLGIHSILKRQEFKANVIDRDKIVVPPNWDSWGKIRVLRDGFDVEAVSGGWAIDLDMDFPTTKSGQTSMNGVNGSEAPDLSQDGTSGHTVETAIEEPEGSAVVLYESQVEDASLDSLQLNRNKNDAGKLEEPAADMQAFLAGLVDPLDKEKKRDEAFAADAAKSKPGKDHSTTAVGTNGSTSATGMDEIISDHIGPVQFNMGGIQVDADDMVQKLKVSRVMFLDKH